MKAREWFDKGEHEEDVFNSFFHFWQAFNSIYHDQKKSAERIKINNFFNNNFSEQIAIDILENHSPEIDLLLSSPIIDMNTQAKDTSENISAFYATDNSLDKLQQLFMIIYQVRCNLVHGQKSPSRKRDLDLCKSATPILKDVLSRVFRRTDNHLT